eukprot:gb/GEZN01006602.1/.p1 GENE.gb/GEZN01006602.1/~~gb/GEZN01006602.1/.p1  ORF type:complete len:517 (-),score=61.71 gb/GEZN01006602.1/:91-1617(-)
MLLKLVASAVVLALVVQAHVVDAGKEGKRSNGSKEGKGKGGNDKERSEEGKGTDKDAGKAGKESKGKRGQDEQPSLVSSLQLATKVLDFSDPAGFLGIDYNFSNPTVREIRFLHWYTPVLDVWSDVFQVTDVATGEVLPYVGKAVKRRNFDPDDELVLPPGFSRRLRVSKSLSFSYAFPRDGEYEIGLKNLSGIPGAPVYDVESLAIRLRFGVQNSVLQKSRFADWKSEEAGYCNEVEEDAVEEGYYVALQDQIPSSLWCLSTPDTCAEEYLAWFGAYDKTQFQRVQSVWHNISKTLPITDHSCHDEQCINGVYAFVYPTDPSMTINLCHLYFDIPFERAETLNHECSHFRGVGDTQDYEYGQPACLELARTYPLYAVENADNFNYYGRFACAYDCLQEGKVLAAGESLKSLNLTHTATVEPTGSFVLYRGTVATWTTNTTGAGSGGPYKLELQPRTQKLVLHDGSRHSIWTSNNFLTGTNPIDLKLLNVGVLVLQDSEGLILWRSNV